MSRRGRRLVPVVILAVAVAVAVIVIGVARSGGAPEPGAAFPWPGSGAAAPVEQNGQVRVYDRGVGGPIELDAAFVEAEKAEAARAPGYLDADGNPRYTLVWEHGQLVPGPALECVPSDVPGEPASCTLAE